MKICRVQYDRVVIPILPAPFAHARMMLNSDTLHDPNAFVEFTTRTLMLKPRAYDGHIVNAAYDHETDTLYIKDE